MRRPTVTDPIKTCDVLPLNSSVAAFLLAPRVSKGVAQPGDYSRALGPEKAQVVGEVFTVEADQGLVTLDTNCSGLPPSLQTKNRRTDSTQSGRKSKVSDDFADLDLRLIRLRTHRRPCPSKRESSSAW